MRFTISRYRQQIFNAFLISALISGCASGPKIITNSDPNADFSKLQTFDFIQPLATDNGNVRSLLSTSLIAATTTELESRGWRRMQENPDVLIDFMFETQEQIRTRNTSASVGMHRGGRYGTWGGTMSTPTVEQTTQGALSVNIVDPARNQLIWEGSATHRVTEEIRQNQDEAARAFIVAIFAEFP